MITLQKSETNQRTKNNLRHIFKETLKVPDKCAFIDPECKDEKCIKALLRN